jgi:transposase
MATLVSTRSAQETAFSPTLFLAFELGVKTWKLGFTTGAAQRPRERQVPAGDCQTVLEERRRAKSRFGLPENTQVVSCYEAGRDGFWLHRFLVGHGVESRVVDSASIEVNRTPPALTKQQPEHDAECTGSHWHCGVGEHRHVPQLQ